MDVNLKKIEGAWNLGYSLDKHSLSSKFTGHNEHGHPQFDTIRTEAGEALYQLKYRRDFSKVDPIAEAIAKDICPLFSDIGLIIPVPPSKIRTKQPVYEIAKSLAKKIKLTVFDNILIKAPATKQLKDIESKEEKMEILKNTYSIKDGIEGCGTWNALIVDDLYDTGSSLEAVTTALRSYNKINNIYAATVTWK